MISIITRGTYTVQYINHVLEHNLLYRRSCTTPLIVTSDVTRGTCDIHICKTNQVFYKRSCEENLLFILRNNDPHSLDTALLFTQCWFSLEPTKHLHYGSVLQIKAVLKVYSASYLISRLSLFSWLDT